MSAHEHQQFLDTWEWESQQTLGLLESLPPTGYDFRPYPQSRSIGEMAWHLAEGDAYMTFAIVNNGFSDEKPPGIARPKTIAELAPGFERIHREAVARVAALKPEDYDRSIPFFDGKPITVRNLLWTVVLHHGIHHRGQLMMMARMAGGTPPGIYGPNFEATEAMKAEMSKTKA